VQALAVRRQNRRGARCFSCCFARRRISAACSRHSIEFLLLPPARAMLEHAYIPEHVLSHVETHHRQGPQALGDVNPPPPQRGPRRLNTIATPGGHAIASARMIDDSARYAA